LNRFFDRTVQQKLGTAAVSHKTGEEDIMSKTCVNKNV
jgi:hypothetical protein